MRTFFLQFFLSFWVVTIGIFIGATVFFPNGDWGSFENQRDANRASALKMAEYVIARYEVTGCEAVGPLGTRFLLTREDGAPVCGAALNGVERDMVASVRSTGRPAGRNIKPNFVEAIPLVLASGERWIVVQRTPSPPRPWYPRLPAPALPVSVAVTFFFAFVMTRPVRALSVAFRRFSSGDLSVRLAVSGSDGGARMCRR